jgi:prevent-host-death family protein
MEVGVFEAKNRLSALIANVARGGEVTITLRGRPVARLVPAGPADATAGARAAAERIKARAATANRPISWAEWRSFRDEGRP